MMIYKSLTQHKKFYWCCCYTGSAFLSFCILIIKLYRFTFTLLIYSRNVYKVEVFSVTSSCVFGFLFQLNCLCMWNDHHIFMLILPSNINQVRRNINIIMFIRIFQVFSSLDIILQLYKKFNLEV